MPQAEPWIGGVSALVGRRARLVELWRRGYWPAQVPAVVLTEALTGGHRRDFHANRLLRACQIRDVDEPQAREGARWRTCTGRAGTISAIDTIIMALASTLPNPVVLTSKLHDFEALAEHTARPITVAGV
jgi:predicted nucleic acid-binding protein